jgi:tRNA U54 and U55 pseudouridine synthase Pus10
MENSFNKIILCKKCNDFISSQLKDKDNITKEETDVLNIKNENENICEFCFNSLNNNDYSYLITKIGEKIKEYEYLHLNIQTRFSCLFNIFHFLLMNKLNQIKNIKKENISEIIKSSQIRKLFKEDFSKIFTKQLNIKIESDPGDMIVVMTFNFRQKIYDEMNTIFKEFQDKDNKIEIISPEDDNSKIKYYLDLINSNNKLIEEINQKLTLDFLCQNFFLDFRINIAPFYIFGNYIKLDREIGQSRFLSKDGVKLSLSSVDEELKSFLKNVFLNKEEDLIMSAGGREDRDVRMLGNGRAFIYTVYNAKKHYSLDFSSINIELNKTLKKVKVNGLRICTKKNFNILKKAESEKVKIYTAFVWSKEEITKEVCDKIHKIKDLLINQITPLRVLHKRVLKTREKFIYEVKIIEIINPHFMIIEIQSSAGTYIKEFVNGDLGRTYPSLGDIIGNECDIIQLDVQDIVL